MPIDILAQDLLECIFGPLPLQAMCQLGRCSKEWRAVVARGLPVRKKQMVEIFRRLYVHSHNKLPEEHVIAWEACGGSVRRMGAHECTLLQSGLKVDEDLPSLLFCYLEEVPAERVIATRTFITESDLLRILDWLQHLPPQRRMMLDLSNHNVPIPRDKWGRAKHVGWVPASIAAHPAVRSRGFLVDLK